MADDPNRDILPVKDGADAISVIDLRERHLVCKLDRYQLEDKYLRLLDEANNLKKLSNCQEDKIKRLGTKLIRLGNNPRSCGLSLDIVDDRNKMSALEFENAKLKEKIVVMRNQLLSHTMNRSSSRSRNLARPTSSGLITCRSDNNRARTSCQYIVASGDNDDNDVRNCLIKIEKLEAQKKDMTSRITELEKELAFSTDSQRVAENVEYIRVWRQMKQLNDKLTTAQEKNTVLTAEINDLKNTLKQTTRNNQEIIAVLTSERTRIAEFDEQVLKAKNSQFVVREKEEQIRDLTSEIKILQQHNNELINITSKYDQVEVENLELRKKLSEHVHEQQTLKIAFSNDQANISALQCVNGQLLSKLEELQASIDTLTIQLKSVNNQNEHCCDAAKNEQCASAQECKKCCEMYDKIILLEKKTTKIHQWIDQSSQTSVPQIKSEIKDQLTIINPSSENKEQVLFQECSKIQESNTNTLSREKILKLLDQAQINTPLDAKITRKNEGSAGNLDASQRHSCQEISSRLLCDESNPVQSNLWKRFANLENPNMNLNQILLAMFDTLQEFMSSNDMKICDENMRSDSQVMDSLVDVNNNTFITTIHDVNQSLNTDAAENADNFTRVIDKDSMTDAENCIHKHEMQINDRCTCINKDCHSTFKSGRHYCTICASNSCTKDCNLPCNEKSVTISMENISSMTKDNIFPIIYEKCKKSSYRDISNDLSVKRSIKRLKSPCYPKCNLTCRLRKARDPYVQEKQKLPYTIECLKDSRKLSECPAEPFPLLISDRQGLIEIHISRLQLSTSIAKIPEEEDICSLYIYISWDIWGEKTAYTQKMKCPDLTFNSSSVYRIADLFSFFKNVLSEYLIFRVNIVRRNESTRTLARAKVSIKDILDYPQNKLHYIVPVTSVITCFFGVNFGQLSLWVRLSCNVDMVEAFKKQCGITSLRDIDHAPPEKKDIHAINFLTPPRTDIDRVYKDQKDVSVSTLISNDESYIDAPIKKEFTPEEIFEERESIKMTIPDSETLIDAIEDTEDSPSVEEFKSVVANDSPLLTRANNTIHDIREVFLEKNWEKYKQKSRLIFTDTIKTNSLNMDGQDYHHDTSTSKVDIDTIIIEIVSISLLEGSSVIEDNEIQLLYVEYSFLGHRGEDMETISVEKSRIPDEEMFYNFTKTFQINEQTHPMEREYLRAMLAEIVSPNIKFLVISEPIPEETEFKECEDVGCAIFNLKHFALGPGYKDISLSIKDSRNKEIGVLKISVLGLDSIRKCLPDNRFF